MNDKIINGINGNTGGYAEKSNQKNAAYGSLLPIYKEFLALMKKSDFANTDKRYVVELNYIKSLKKIAEDKGFSEDIEMWQKKEEEITGKLKEEFGITFNS